MPTFKPNNRRKITEAEKQQLKELKEKTGIGAMALLSQAQNTIPDGLKAKMIDNWVEGKLKTAQADHIKFVLSEWKIHPQYEFVIISPEIQKKLLALKEQSGVGATTLLRNTRSHRPSELSSPLINKWLKSPGKKARKDHLDFVIKKWVELANSNERRIVINESMMRELKSYSESTGLSPKKIMEISKDAPVGLSAATISSWLSGGSKTVQKNYWDFIIELWSKQPQVKPYKMVGEFKHLQQNSLGRVTVTEKIKGRLQELKEKSHLGARAFLVKCSDQPKGLNPGIIESVMKGTSKTIQADHLEYILHHWDALASTNERVKIDESSLQILKKYRELGFIPKQILKKSHDIPEGLTAPMITQWLYGQTTTAKRIHLNYVLEKCAAYKASPMRRVTITEEMRKILEDESNRTGLGPKKFLDKVHKYPEEISVNLVASWLHGRASTARKDLYDFVVKEWRRIP